MTRSLAFVHLYSGSRGAIRMMLLLHRAIRHCCTQLPVGDAATVLITQLRERERVYDWQGALLLQLQARARRAVKASFRTDFFKYQQQAGRPSASRKRLSRIAVVNIFEPFS
jgi:hypothetical protein